MALNIGQQRAPNGRFGKSMSGATAVPTPSKPRGKKIPGTTSETAPTVSASYERFRKTTEPNYSRQQNAIMEQLDVEDGETCTVSGRSMKMFGGDVEIYCSDSEYTVLSHTLVSSGSLWSPPEYAEVEIGTTSDPEEAVDIAREVDEHGADYATKDEW